MAKSTFAKGDQHPSDKHRDLGLKITEVAFLLLTQRPWVQLSAFPPKIISMLLRFINGAGKRTEA